MQMELDKYGIHMPSFGKIGGILANEVSRDTATTISCDCHVTSLFSYY